MSETPEEKRRRQIEEGARDLQNDPSARQQMHDASAALPQIALGLITAGLRRRDDSAAFSHQVADLSAQAMRLLGNRDAGLLALFSQVAETWGPNDDL